jgi:hypothetical protein
VADVIQTFITAMDAVKMNMTAVDQVQRRCRAGLQLGLGVREACCLLAMAWGKAAAQPGRAVHELTSPPPPPPP